MLEHPVTGEPDDVIIEVPHDPKAEATLLQETRERVSMLQNHVALPEQVGALQRLDRDLEAMMYSVSETDEYGCTDCIKPRSAYERSVRMLEIIECASRILSETMEGTPDGYQFMADVIQDSASQMAEAVEPEDFV